MPSAEPKGVGVILIPGGAHTPAINRNRMFVRLARRLAAQGYHVLRYDFHGVGESTGFHDGFSVGRVYRKGVHAGMKCLNENGAEQIVLFGTCFGARLAAFTAVDVQNLAGLVLLAPPPIDQEGAGEGATVVGAVRERSASELIKRLLDRRQLRNNIRVIRGRLRAVSRALVGKLMGRKPRPDEWVGHLFLAQMRDLLVTRKVPTVIIWGTEDDYYDQWERAAEHRLGTLLEDARGTTRVDVHEGHIHLFLKVETQDFVIDHSVEWMKWIEEHDPGFAAQSSGREANKEAGYGIVRGQAT
jgi:pimeloyl-ACP methyl ester carboxylesterase